MTVTWKEPYQGSLEGVSLLLPVWKLHSRNPHVWIYTFALPEHTHDSHFTRDTGDLCPECKETGMGQEESPLGRIILLCRFSWFLSLRACKESEASQACLETRESR